LHSIRSGFELRSIVALRAGDARGAASGRDRGPQTGPDPFQRSQPADRPAEALPTDPLERKEAAAIGHQERNCDE